MKTSLLVSSVSHPVHATACGGRAVPFAHAPSGGNAAASAGEASQPPAPPAAAGADRGSSRRQFLKRSGRVLAVSALAGVPLPAVHAAADEVLHLALIGCGGRGTGAVENAFEAPGGPVKLTVMADLFPDRLQRSLETLRTRFGARVDVPPERQFLGFDAYRRAIDSLRRGDIALLTGYAGFRPAQLEYAVEKGVHVFMEKSFATDPPGVRRVIRAGERADQRNVKIAAGLQCRHSRNRQELIRRLRDGALGDIQLIRAYRMQPVGALGPRPPAANELHWQIRNFVHFFWVSGGLFAEMNIHQIDEICWIKDAWPVTAHGVGGRAADSRDCGQNLDSLAIEWTFADGTKATDTVRWLGNCHTDFATYIHGTKCAAQFSGPNHKGTVHIYKDQRCSRENIAWRAPDEDITPWQAEWNDFLQAIRQDLPYNEAKRAALSNLADIMGRAAVHSGKVVTWDEALNSDFAFFPDIDRLSADSPPPLRADAQGRYPVPVPGVWTEL